MATRYADRAFISVNGFRMFDVQSASLKQNRNAKAVPTMTPNRRNRGFTEGNLDIDISIAIAVQNGQASPKLEAVDFEAADVQITFLMGADQYTATGVFLGDADQSAGGVGDEVKKNFNLKALDLVDSVGNSALFDISL